MLKSLPVVDLAGQVWATDPGPTGRYFILPKRLDGTLIAAIEMPWPGALNLAWQIATVPERAQSKHAKDLRGCTGRELYELLWVWDRRLQPVDRRGRILRNSGRARAIVFEKSLGGASRFEYRMLRF